MRIHSVKRAKGTRVVPRRHRLPAAKSGRRFEKLEDRTLLAGDMLAGLGSAGTLTIIGDDNSNGVIVRTVQSRVPDSLRVTGGETGVTLDDELLAAVGLVISSPDADPGTPGFQADFPITPDSDFRIALDGSVPPIGGIEHSGTVSFNSDTLTVGDFTIGFDASRAVGAASGFYVQDTFSLGAILFDIGAPSISVNGGSLSVITDQLLVSPELAGVLGDSALAGVDVGDAEVDATVAVYQLRQVHGGVTSVGLDPAALQAAGLELTGADGVVDPVSSDFLVGFPIGADADFQFSLTDGVLTPLSGQITHTGTVTFNDAVTVGNFVIGYDPTRADASSGASGFFVQDTFSVGAILFDIGVPSNVSLSDPDATIGPADLLVSGEFAGFLGNMDLAGVDAGDAQIDATVYSIVAPFVKVEGFRHYYQTTTINGDRSVMFPLDEVTNLDIQAGEGSDSVRLYSLNLAGAIDVALGSGFVNSLLVNGVRAASLSVEGGNGFDVIILRRTSTDVLSIDTYGGLDKVALWRTYVGQETNINLGSGSDYLGLFYTQLEGDTTLDGGAGLFDRFYSRYSEYEGDVLNFRWFW